MDADRLSHFDGVAAEWDALAERCSAAPWLYPAWFEAWWEAFGKGGLELITVRRQGELVGLAPLFRRRGELLSLTNWHTPGWDLLAQDDAALARLAEELFRGRPRRVGLGFLDADGQTLRACREAADGAGLQRLERLYNRALYVPVTGSWDTYRPPRAKMAANVRRRKRRLEAAGELVFDIRGAGTRLEALMDEMYRLEASGWKGREGTAIESRPETRRFYAQMAAWAEQRSWLKLATLRLDGRLLAFQMCFEAGGSLHSLKIGYDEEFRRDAPGTILHGEVIRYTFESGLKSYEFCGAEMPYKLEWTTESHDQQMFQAFARTPAGWAGHIAQRHGRPAAKAMVRRASELRKKAARG